MSDDEGGEVAKSDPREGWILSRAKRYLNATDKRWTDMKTDEEREDR